MDDDSSPPDREHPASTARSGADGDPDPSPVEEGEDGRGIREVGPVDETIRTVAHDFNHFLTAIVGSVQLALEALPPDTAVADDLELALDSAHRAAALTRKLLVPDEQRGGATRTVDLVEIVRKTAGVLRRTAGDAIRLKLELPDHPVPVRIDAANVERILLNLVVNGRDAIEGSGEISVAVRAEDGAVDGEAVIEVRDDGSGMNEAEREAVFEPSFTTKDSGTGLGLAIVRRMMKEAGGSMEVESEPGAGTTFRARVPLSDGRPERPERQGSRTDSRNRGDRVLVVSGDPGARKVVAEALKRRGYRTFAAAGPEEAGELLDSVKEPPDLLVVEIVLSDPWGFDLAEKLRKRCPDAAVLFISGDPLRALSKHRPRIEREAFVGKPFSIEELLSALRSAVEHHHRARRDAREGA